MLVAGGASLTLPDYEGNTPRLLALHAEDTELAAYLGSKLWQLYTEEVYSTEELSENAVILCCFRDFLCLYNDFLV